MFVYQLAQAERFSETKFRHLYMMTQKLRQESKTQHKGKLNNFSKLTTDVLHLLWIFDVNGYKTALKYEYPCTRVLTTRLKNKWRHLGNKGFFPCGWKYRLSKHRVSVVSVEEITFPVCL